MSIRIKNEKDIEAMRKGGVILSRILKILEKAAKPGVSPRALAHLAQQELSKTKGKPTFQGVGLHPPYPDIICISVNNQVQHAIPSSEVLEAGDVVNFDFGVTYDGLITDAGISVGIGSVDDEAKRLLTGTAEALEAGLAEVHDGCRVGDISAAIELVLKSYRLGIVRDLVGHGVGYELHEAPNIPNYGRRGIGPLLKSGMTIAIEPIATLGSEQIVVDPDGWTLWSADGSWSAQYERTVLVTDNGYEILTPW